MAALSSILAWIFSPTEEPGRLQSMGLQRIRYSRAYASNNIESLFLLHIIVGG